MNVLWLLQFVILNMLFPLSFGAYYFTTKFQCRGFDPWVVDYSDNAIASERFQSWLYAWQHDCARKQVSSLHLGEIGLGASINYLLNDMLSVIGSGQIYQTLGPSLWAERNSSLCSLNHTSGFDCFLLPLSRCKHENHVNPIDFQVDPYHNVFNTTAKIDTAIGRFSSKGIGICDMAILSKKSMQWVHGQLVKYLVRPGYQMQADINKRFQRVFSDPINEKDIVIGVQIRAVNPKTIDFGRHEVSVQHIMNQVDAKVEELKSRGKIVTKVYLCSHVQEENIISSEHMTLTYPNRTYQFIVLPHKSFGKGSAEVENLLSNPKVLEKPLVRDIVTEFFADLYILSKSQVFFGTFSNIYPVVASMRVADQFGIKNNDTCYFDTRVAHDPPLLCEGYVDSHAIWKSYVGKMDAKDPGRGYDESFGVPF